MFGYVLHESYLQYPGVLTARGIQKRLNISYNAALNLKRRLQLFASEQMPAVRKLMREELRSKFKSFKFPRDPEADLTEYTQTPIPTVDTVVLFSASQRANKGRKRHRHGGQTASIYMSDNLGGKQVGTLTQIISWKGGPLVVDSIPDQRMETLKPLLDTVLSPSTPVFTDEGYRFLYRVNKNHRMINHSARSPDARWKYARNRWSKNGVHSQVAEGNGRLVKSAFSAYGWIKPEHSTLYLNEFSFIRSSMYYGLEQIARASRKLSGRVHKGNAHTEARLTRAAELTGRRAHEVDVHPQGKVTAADLTGRHQLSQPGQVVAGASALASGPADASAPLAATGRAGRSHCYEVTANPVVLPEATTHSSAGARVPKALCGFEVPNMVVVKQRWLQSLKKTHSYKPPSLDERQRVVDDTNKGLDPGLKRILKQRKYGKLKGEVDAYFCLKKTGMKKHVKAAEGRYRTGARQLWEALVNSRNHKTLTELIGKRKLSRVQLYRVIGRWSELGIAEVEPVKQSRHLDNRKEFLIKRKVPALPPVCYTTNTNSRGKINDKKK